MNLKYFFLHSALSKRFPLSLIFGVESRNPFGNHNLWVHMSQVGYVKSTFEMQLGNLVTTVINRIDQENLNISHGHEVWIAELAVYITSYSHPTKRVESPPNEFEPSHLCQPAKHRTGVWNVEKNNTRTPPQTPQEREYSGYPVGDFKFQKALESSHFLFIWPLCKSISNGNLHCWFVIQIRWR